MRFLVIFIFVLSLSKSFAQNYKQFIPISVFVSDEGIKDFPQSRDLLENFLLRSISTSGLSGTDNSRFYITPKIAIVSKRVLAGPPSKLLATVNITFYIADNSNGKVFNTSNFNLTGAGNSDFDAISDAIAQLDNNDKNYQSFIETSRNRITEYYSSICEQIIASAKIKSTSDIFSSLLELSMIPETNTNCFMKAQKISKEIYDIHVENTCLNDISKAKLIWSKGLDRRSADESMRYISNTYLTSNCQNELNTLVNDINTKLQIDKQNEINLKELDKKNEARRTELIGQALIEYCKNQPKPVYNTNLIFIR